ncbi:MAG TPA: HEAT repeat domain-containing protein [Planctomycetota bacterium]|nr:HEAT repeat domain-containing protein [Planctomycetota bacterium]
MTEDRELQKQIAEEAQVDVPTAAGPVVRAFQFFLVPLLIVGACVLVYSILNWVVANPRSAQEWLVDVKEGGPNTRHHALIQLSQTIRRMDPPDQTLTPELIALFRATPEDPDPNNFNLHKYLASCMGYLRDPRACDLLLEAITKYKSSETRAAAMDALGTIKDPRTLPDLVKLLDDSEPLVRKYAAFNAGAVAEKATGEARASAQAALKKALADPASDVTWNTAFALAYFLGDGSGTDTLKKMLDRKYLGERINRNDPNWDMLEARAMFTACNAAARLKDESFLPLLKELTDIQKERDADVRFAAHQAIHKIQEKK